MSQTYYKADSVLAPNKKAVARVLTFVPRAEECEDGTFVGCMPNGSYVGGDYRSEDDAIRTAEEELALQGWTTDHEQATKDAERQAEARNARKARNA